MVHGACCMLYASTSSIWTDLLSQYTPTSNYSNYSDDTYSSQL